MTEADVITVVGYGITAFGTGWLSGLFLLYCKKVIEQIF